jgi:hypothetical protein
MQIKNANLVLARKLMTQKATFQEGIICLSRASRENNAEAQYCMYEMHMLNKLPHMSKKEAVAYLIQAAAREYTKAEYVLGVEYTGMYSYCKDADKSFAFLEKAAKKDVQAKMFLVHTYAKFFSPTDEMASTISVMLQELAYSGDAFSQYNLSLSCTNETEKYKLLRASAKSGHVRAQQTLVHTYLKEDLKNNSYQYFFSCIKYLRVMYVNCHTSPTSEPQISEHIARLQRCIVDRGLCSNAKHCSNKMRFSDVFVTNTHGFKTCSACRKVLYCSRECQTSHWNRWHKYFCK